MPNWVFLAVPLALLCFAYWIYSAIQYRREQRLLRWIFDGDRLEWERSVRHNLRRVNRLAAGHGGLFIRGNHAKRKTFWIRWRV